MVLSKDLISTYVCQMPTRIREYLISERGLTPPIIWNHQLGWNGSRITIPILDRRRRLVFFKLARGPDVEASEPKMLCWPAGQSTAELYGWEHLRSPFPSLLVICEGEFDRLLLESHGIPAVTGTAGAQVFATSWTADLARVPNLYVCYDRDEAGLAGAHRVAGLLPHVRIVELPEAVGPGGDVSDFFVRLHRTTGEFRELLADAQPHPEAPRLSESRHRSTKPRAGMAARLADNPRTDGIKSGVPIEAIARVYIPDLRRSGNRLVGKCIFHADSTPSLVLYPEQGRFHCYGCGTHGDVIQFLMEAECWSFSRALQALEKYLRSLEP